MVGFQQVKWLCSLCGRVMKALAQTSSPPLEKDEVWRNGAQADTDGEATDESGSEAGQLQGQKALLGGKIKAIFC